MNEIYKHQEISQHFNDLLAALKSNISEISEFLELQRTTTYKYGFDAATKGARKIPVHHLDKIRVLAIDNFYKELDEMCAEHMPDSFTYEAYGFITHLKNRFIWELAKSNRVLNDDVAKKYNFNDDEMRRFKWLRAKFNGSINVDDMMEITGLSEYEVGRIGLIGYTWGIEVKSEWTASL